LAKSGGGDILFGVDEKKDSENKKTGTIGEIIGIDNVNFDDLKQKIENIVRDSTRPRVTIQLPTEPISVNEDKCVLIIRVPHTWNPPHAVLWNKVPRFYARTSAGKYPLDVEQIRESFIKSETVRERIKQYRFERIEKILAGDLPVEFFEKRGSVRTVIHIHPLSSFSTNKVFDLVKMRNEEKFVCFSHYQGKRPEVPLFESRLFLDGIYFCNSHEEPREYVSISHQGNIEIVIAGILPPSNKLIVLRNIQINNLFQTVFGILPNFPFPVLIDFSVLNCKGGWFKTNEYSTINHVTVDRDHLLLQSELIEKIPEDPIQILKLFYDRIANSVNVDEAPPEWLRTS